jgi:hypothetical protein
MVETFTPVDESAKSRIWLAPSEYPATPNARRPPLRPMKPSRGACIGKAGKM